MCSAIFACSSRTPSLETRSTDPFGDTLFSRTSPAGVRIVAKLMVVGCIEELHVTLADGQASGQLGGGRPYVTTESHAPLEIVDSHWEAVSVRVSDRTIESVEWTDSEGRVDRMRPVKGWAVFASSLLRPLRLTDAPPTTGPRPVDGTKVAGLNRQGTVVAQAEVPAALSSPLVPVTKSCPAPTTG
jgi:hypothetical protein